MRVLLLLLSTFTFRLQFSNCATFYSSDSVASDEEIPPVLNRLLSAVKIEETGGDGDGDKLIDNGTIIEDRIGVGRDFENVTPNSQVSSLTSPSPELIKFAHYDERHYLPRGPSIHNEAYSAPKHVSFGWTQFSDNRWMPSIDMEDTEENRKHILMLMLVDARHGNLEYFKFLADVLDRFPGANVTAPFSNAQELDIENPNSLIFAAVHSDNVELFCEVMKFKGLTFTDLNPFAKLRKSPKIEFSPGSYPPRGTSVLDSVDSDDWAGNSSDEEDELPNVEDTVFGQAVIQNSIYIVNLLLENGIKDEFPERTNTALHFAIKYGHEILVQILLKRGGSQIDRINGAFMTPLMIAIHSGYPKIVKMLLNWKASVFITDFKQRNCFHYAAEKGHMVILRVLRETFLTLSPPNRFALINAEDVKKKTPFDYANNSMVSAYIISYYLIDNNNKL